MRRAACAAAAALAILAGTGSSAADTSLEIYPPERDGDFQTSGGIFVRGDSLGNRVRVDYLPGREAFEVRDSRSRLKLRTGDLQAERCRLITRHIARCANPEPTPERAALTIPLRMGADILLPARSLRTPIAAGGGPGIDTINGALGDDVLKGGGGGGDLVRGHAGADNILGGEGDVLSAGRGADVILADYGTVEGSINCGSGQDRAYVDAADAAAIRCEQVIVRDARRESRGASRQYRG